MDNNKKIAIIGTGITGLSCAWHLDKYCDIKVFEKAPQIGGHSHSVKIGDQFVDMGFIVFNQPCYPNLCALFDELKVAHELSNMSFGVSMDDGCFEYSSLKLLAQKTNILSPRYIIMMLDIMRFYKKVPQIDKSKIAENYTLGQYLSENNYSNPFINDHLIPQAAAIWSTSPQEMLEYPFLAFLGFFENHGLLELDLEKRIPWRTITGASRAYVEKLSASFANKINVNSNIKAIYRKDGKAIIISDAGEEIFDEIVFTCHADEALALLQDANPLEKEILGAFTYTNNQVVLHHDESFMPKRKAAWASWNYLGQSDLTKGVSLTYWMNLLQNLKGEQDYFVTLNPARPIDVSKTIKEMQFTHPKFDDKALKAQEKMAQIMGKQNYWFGGAYLGFGFHEDGLQAGLMMAENISGIKRPWAFDWQKSRIAQNLNGIK